MHGRTWAEDIDNEVARLPKTGGSAARAFLIRKVKGGSCGAKFSFTASIIRFLDANIASLVSYDGWLLPGHEHVAAVASF